MTYNDKKLTNSRAHVGYTIHSLSINIENNQNIHNEMWCHLEQVWESVWHWSNYPLPPHQFFRPLACPCEWSNIKCYLTACDGNNAIKKLYSSNIGCKHDLAVDQFTMFYLGTPLVMILNCNIGTPMLVASWHCSCLFFASHYFALITDSDFNGISPSRSTMSFVVHCVALTLSKKLTERTSVHFKVDFLHFVREHF